jgi:hypothetical protein
MSNNDNPGCCAILVVVVVVVVMRCWYFRCSDFNITVACMRVCMLCILGTNILVICIPFICH